jgi:hypothetical protein
MLVIKNNKMVFSKPIQTIFVGKDIDHSIEDGEYIAYPTQEWALDKAMKNDGLLILTVNRIPRYKIRIKKYIKLDTKQYLDLEFKKYLIIYINIILLIIIWVRIGICILHLIY